MELYIIRHAQSANNALRDPADRVCDPHLTELGRQQAARLARHLANEPHSEQRHGSDPEETSVETIAGYGIVKLYCSAMHRSLETAMTSERTGGGTSQPGRRIGQRVKAGQSGSRKSCGDGRTTGSAAPSRSSATPASWKRC